MGLSKKIAFNTIIQIVGKAFNISISLLVIKILTDFLGVDGWGKYVTIITFVGIFAVLANLGVAPILVREISKENADIEFIIGNVLGLGSISFLLLFFAPLSSLLIPNYGRSVKIGILIAILYQLFFLINKSFSGFFQSKLKMENVVIGEVVNKLVVLGLIFYVLQFFSISNRVLVVICILIIGAFVNLTISYFLVSRYIKIRILFDLDYWRHFLKESLPMALMSILGVVHFRIDTILLSVLKPAFDVGIYGLAYKIIEIALFFPVIFVGLVFPSLSFYSLSDKQRTKIIFQRAFDFLVITVVPIVGAISILSPYIIMTISDQKFYPSINILRILSLSLLATFIAHLFNHTIVAIGKQRELAIRAFMVVVINITLNLIFIPKYSYMGAAIITFITETLMTYLVFTIIKKEMQLIPSLEKLLKATCSTIIMLLTFWGCKKLNFFSWILFIELSKINRFINLTIIAIILFIIYFFSLYILKGISQEDIRILIGK